MASKRQDDKNQREENFNNRSADEDIGLKAAQQMKEFLAEYDKKPVVDQNRIKAAMVSKRQDHNKQRDEYVNGVNAKAAVLRREVRRLEGIEHRSSEEQLQLKAARKKLKEFVDDYKHQQVDLRHLDEIVKRGSCGDPGLVAKLDGYTADLAELDGTSNRTDDQQVTLNQTTAKYAEALAESEEERRAYDILQRVHAISAHMMDPR
jgi:hypothetical protein